MHASGDPAVDEVEISGVVDHHDRATFFGEMTFPAHGDVQSLDLEQRACDADDRRIEQLHAHQRSRPYRGFAAV